MAFGRGLPCSGCGKSTLMRLANGLCPHYFQGTLEGRVLIGGEPTDARPINTIAREVGTLFQDPEQQFFALNVEDELAFAHEWQGVSPEAIAAKIDEAARAFAGKDAFDTVWQALASWENATFIMAHLGSVIEIKGKIPEGRHGHGYFNLSGGSGLGGHLKIDDLGHICFLSLPFMGLESHSVQFFNAAGTVLFSVYVGRENRQLIPAARESFFALREAVGTKDPS